MNYLKTYESFFNLEGYEPNSKDLIRMIGVDRHTIEDLLVGFEDNFPDIHISISFYDFFKFDNSYKIGDASVSKWMLDNPYNQNGALMKTILVRIIFLPSGRLLDKSRNKLFSKGRDIQEDRDNWYKIVVGDLDEEISSELESLKKRVELLGFYDFYLHKRTQVVGTINFSLLTTSKISSIKGENNDIGYSIFEVTFKKDIKIK